MRERNQRIKSAGSFLSNREGELAEMRFASQTRAGEGGSEAGKIGVARRARRSEKKVTGAP